MLKHTGGTTLESIENYVDAGYIAEKLSIARSCVFNLAKAGKFPSGLKIGGSRRWSMAEIEEFLNAQKRGTSNE